MGNRGGRFHRDDQTCGNRRWASKRWICCKLEFAGRHREVWKRGYTHLFFLDEPTALSAGHRPCFECRRQDAKAFTALWQRASQLMAPIRAPEMDEILHAERNDGRLKRLHRRPIDELPDGAFVAMHGQTAFAVRDELLLQWSPAGYDRSVARPRGIVVDVLTPPSILSVLAQGYTPIWHPSAG